VLEAAQRGLDAVNALLAVVSATALAMAGGVLTWEVVGRYFLGIPSDWQDELSVFLLIGATFGSAAWIQSHRGHVSIDAVAALLSPGAEAWRRRVSDLFSLMFCGFFTWKSWSLLVEAWVDGQTTPSAWGPPLWIPYGCMTAGMALLTIQLLLQLLSSIQPPPLNPEDMP
jgi:TRAP-type C4-dicarboxylate transport system permease small subunit